MPWVSQSGTTGIDHSVNAPAYGGLNLLQTIAVKANRNAIGVQNQSTATLTLVRDDGNADAGTVTVLILSPAAAAGGQGSDWSSQTFKGRLRIYGTAGSQLAAWED